MKAKFDVRILLALAVILSVIVIIFVSESLREKPIPITTMKPSEETSNVPPKSEWLKASAHIYVGVKLYYGPKKTYVGEVVDFSEKCQDPTTGKVFRCLSVKMKSGNVEIKDRTAVITGDWYVRADDPALK